MLKPTVLAVLRVAKWWSVKTIRVYSLVANAQAKVVAEMISKNIAKQEDVSSLYCFQ